MPKVDYKKDYKPLYLPKSQPELITVPPIPFVVIDGQGDPNGPEFSMVTEALYAFSYALKMSYKSETPPPGYYEYTVFPLEGVWDLVDPSKGLRKDNLKYQLMIRQPDFLTESLFQYSPELAKKKKKNPHLESLRFETITEGLCCQTMHFGSYDDEPESFNKISDFLSHNGYKRLYKTHREIYLSDPRKTATEKLKTVLRVQVEAICPTTH